MTYRIAYFLMLGLSLGCTPQQKTAEISKNPYVIPEGEPRKLTIAHAPRTGAFRWEATFARGADNRWMIEKSPQGRLISDTLAHDTFIEHFVDSLRTLSIVNEPGAGTDQRFGFSPPEWRFEWEILGQPYELDLGVYDPVTTGTFARVRVGDATRIAVLKGAALALLGHVKSESDPSGFDYFREPLVVPFDTDAIYEVVEIKGGKKRSWNREGSEWRSAQTKKIDPRFEDRFERLTHLRALRLIDLAEAPTLPSKPTLLYQFRDRQQRWTELVILGTAPLEVYSNARPKAKLELHPQALQALGLR